MTAHSRTRSEIEWNLHAGPFSERLREAITDSGLSLQRISLKLAERGARVSPAALSYWQRGDNRPERADSLRAVRLLEEILHLPADTLMVLLGPPRPRGRWSAPSTHRSIQDLWPDAQCLRRALTSLDEHAARSLRAVSTVYAHLTETITAERTSASTHVHKVVRAQTDGVDRIIAVMHTAGTTTTIDTVRPCRLGRVRTDEETGYLVAEVLLDRVLNTGQTATLEYITRTPDADPRTSEETFMRHFLYRAAPVLVLEVQFDPAALPVHCTGFYSPRKSTPAQTLGPLWVGSSDRAHLAMTDLDPGMYGIRWEWS